MSSSRSALHRASAATLVAAALAVLACRDDAGRPASPTEPPLLAASEPGMELAATEATASVAVAVPAGLRSAPFDVERRLTVPAGYAVRVHARVPGARFLAMLPNGDLLASVPSQGKVVRVRGGGPGTAATVSDWVAKLRKPHDLVVHTLDGVTYVYVTETHQVSRYAYDAATGTAGARQVIIGKLPDASAPELRGVHGHQLKNIALDGNRLFLSLASPTNASPADVRRTPKGGAIYLYDAAGRNGRLYAQGLRNAEGLAMAPGSGPEGARTLWVAVNNRDNVAYPFHRDITGDGKDDYGKVVPAYVDDHPPEPFTSVRDGGNYGWPFCNPSPDGTSGFDDMPFDRDVQNNADGRQLDCARADRIVKGIPAHSAPLGLTFWTGARAPAEYAGSAVVALHGSWNRRSPSGYQVVVFAWNQGAQRPGAMVPLITGWTTGGVWGRPVDVAVAPDGGLFVSDDRSGTIYALTPPSAPPPPPPPGGDGPRVTGLTLIDADTDLPVPGFDPIPDGATISLRALGVQHLNVRANTATRRVGSVRFGLDDNPKQRTESIHVYSMFGDDGPWPDGRWRFRPWTPTLGTHTLTGTAFKERYGRGAPGGSVTVRLTIAP